VVKRHQITNAKTSVGRLGRRPFGGSSRARRRRTAATLLESALSLAIFVTLVLGSLDLGMWIFRRHVLTQTARQIARQAIVHGALAEELGPWGPDTITSTAAGGSAGTSNDPLSSIQEIAEQNLVGLEAAAVTVQVEWVDGGNDPQQSHRVRTTLTTPFTPIMTFIFGNPSFSLTASSTMQIAH